MSFSQFNWHKGQVGGRVHIRSKLPPFSFVGRGDSNKTYCIFDMLLAKSQSKACLSTVWDPGVDGVLLYPVK